MAHAVLPRSTMIGLRPSALRGTAPLLALVIAAALLHADATRELTGAVAGIAMTLVATLALAVVLAVHAATPAVVEPGDRVELEPDRFAYVRALRWSHAVVDTEDGATVFVPHRSLSTGRVRVHARASQARRASTPR